MDSVNDSATRTHDGDLVFTREYRAPRAVVFQAWTDCDQLRRWWGPEGFTTPHCTIDLRPSGFFHYDMRSSQGDDFWGLGTYREVVDRERLVYVDTFSDEHGRPVPPSTYGMSSGHPSEILVTVEFADTDEGTRLTVRNAMPDAFEERDDFEAGWNQMLDRLGAHVEAGARGDALS
jgi:uncharacterized protein YndB with AHSA1/START domain